MGRVKVEDSRSKTATNTGISALDEVVAAVKEQVGRRGNDAISATIIVHLKE
jgi:hypothetical protein